MNAEKLPLHAKIFQKSHKKLRKVKKSLNKFKINLRKVKRLTLLD